MVVEVAILPQSDDAMEGAGTELSSKWLSSLSEVAREDVLLKAAAGKGSCSHGGIDRFVWSGSVCIGLIVIATVGREFSAVIFKAGSSNDEGECTAVGAIMREQSPAICKEII